MTIYEYILSVKDEATSKMKEVMSWATNLDNKMDNTTRSIAGIGRESKKSFGILKLLGGLAIGAFAAFSISGFVNDVISIRGEFEKYEKVLSNTFQSAEAGKTAMLFLQDFASQTPYQVNELTGSYIKLVNRGFIPAQDEMRKMGDLAASQGKSFDQLTEAILDAGSGEFERLKEFGIRASKSGDKVALTFKGITKEVAMNETAINNAVLAYGDMEGVAGSMAVQMDTIPGKISNIKDKFEMFMNKIGEAGDGVIKNVLDLLGRGMDFLYKNVDNISAFFGSVWDSIVRIDTAFRPIVEQFKEFLGLDTSPLETFQNLFSGIAFFLDLVATGFEAIFGWFVNLDGPLKNLIFGLAAFKIVMWLVNIAMAANPVFLIIMGVTLLIAGIGVLIKYTKGWGEMWTSMGKVASNLGNILKEYVVNRFKEIVSGIKGVGEAIIAFLTGDFDRAVEISKQSFSDLAGLGSGGKLLKDTFGAVDWVSFDSEGFKNDFEGIKNSFSKAKGQDEYDLSKIPGLDNKNSNKDGKGGSASDKAKKASNGIVSGGEKQVNITVNLQKLQDKVEIHSHNLKEGVNEMETMVKEALLRVLNSANQMQID